jgi:hypothetical protein
VELLEEYYLVPVTHSYCVCTHCWKVVELLECCNITVSIHNVFVEVKHCSEILDSREIRNA